VSVAMAALISATAVAISVMVTAPLVVAVVVIRVITTALATLVVDVADALTLVAEARVVELLPAAVLALIRAGRRTDEAAAGRVRRGRVEGIAVDSHVAKQGGLCAEHPAGVDHEADLRHRIVGQRRVQE